MKLNTRCSVNRTRISSIRHHRLFSVDEAAISQVFLLFLFGLPQRIFLLKMAEVVTFCRLGKSIKI